MIDKEIMKRFEDHIVKAKTKHPTFASNLFHAMTILGEEYGEACAELNNKPNFPTTWKERWHEEILDMVAVCYRIIEQDKHPRNDAVQRIFK